MRTTEHNIIVGFIPNEGLARLLPAKPSFGMTKIMLTFCPYITESANDETESSDFETKPQLENLMDNIMENCNKHNSILSKLEEQEQKINNSKAKKNPKPKKEKSDAKAKDRVKTEPKGPGKILNIYECQTCHQTYTNKRKLRKHEKTHKDLTLYTCRFCQKIFSSKEGLRKHGAEHRDFRCVLQKCILHLSPLCHTKRIKISLQ